MGLNKIFDEFNELYGLERKPIDHNLESMYSLITDETNELEDEVFPTYLANKETVPIIANVIKEAIDTIYITGQQLRERGVDLDAALAEVHRSNMSKGSPDCDGEEYHWAIKERDIAKERYPSACIDYVGPPAEAYVIKCGETGKVIRPTTYSPALITAEMIGINT